MSALGRLDVVAIDCTDPQPLVEFWCAVLGTGVASREPDWIALEPTVPGGPHLAFQIVPEPKLGKNRLHLDLDVDDLRSAVPAAEALGATRLGEIVQEPDGRFQVMADPAGNEFCLCDSRAESAD